MLPITITPLGFAFLAVGVSTLLFRREWLFPLLIISACLHAPAVLLVQASAEAAAIGISPWLVTAGLVGIDFVLRLIRDRAALPSQIQLRSLSAAWAAFFLVCALTAFTLPWLFEGLLTLTPENRLGIATTPVPLTWRTTNAVQAVNALVLSVVFLYAGMISRRENCAALVFHALIVALALSVLASMVQRLHLLGVMPDVTTIGQSLNPSYVQTTGYWLPNVPRMNWPFSEPSYASAWFAAFFCGGLASALFGPKSKMSISVTLLAAVGLLNSMGGTGIAATAAFFIAASAVALYRALRSNHPAHSQTRQRLNDLSKWFALSLAALVITVASLKSDPRFSDLGIKNFYTSIILPRIFESEYVAPDAPTRSSANKTALTIVLQTYGLGVGLGSNRGSSFLLTMASNIGVLLTGVFIFLSYRQMRKMLKQRDRTHINLVLFGSVGMLLALLAGIPDLNWPGWWVWVAAGVATLRSERYGEASALSVEGITPGGSSR